ncbi:hypothetical protein D3C73_1597800 [compost metagenome]
MERVTGATAAYTEETGTIGVMLAANKPITMPGINNFFFTLTIILSDVKMKDDGGRYPHHPHSIINSASV